MTLLPMQVDAPEDVDVPQHLLAPEDVEQLVAERQPRFIPLERYGPGADPTPVADSATGGANRAILLDQMQRFLQRGPKVSLVLIDATDSMLAMRRVWYSAKEIPLYIVQRSPLSSGSGMAAERLSLGRSGLQVLCSGGCQTA
jgi:hypothetical protein